jgi:predicted MPP superfamily phosphohydrolase
MRFLFPVVFLTLLGLISSWFFLGLIRPIADFLDFHSGVTWIFGCVGLSPMLLILWMPMIRWNRAREVWSAWDDRLQLWAFLSMAGMSFLLLGLLIRATLFWIFDFSSRPGALAMSSIAILGATVIALLLGWRSARGPVTLERVSVRLGSSNPGSLLTIAQISDLHVGPTLKRDYVERVVDQVMALKPQLIFLTGDIGDGDPEVLSRDLEPLGRLNAPQGVYYVTGNHEHYWDAPKWVHAMQSLGMRPLMNSGQRLSAPWSSVGVAGISDFHSDLEAAHPGIADVPIKLLLAHQPKHAQKASALGFTMMFSGHTHRGQFYPWVWLVRWVHRHHAGLSREGAMQVYVNRGTGYWGPPTRLGASSEITYFEVQT